MTGLIRDFLISGESLATILQSKTLRRLLLEILYETDSYGVIHNLTVTRFTKRLHYKNKSTVSRALKRLKKMEFIIPINQTTYQLNDFVLQEPI